MSSRSLLERPLLFAIKMLPRLVPSVYSSGLGSRERFSCSGPARSTDEITVNHVATRAPETFFSTCPRNLSKHDRHSSHRQFTFIHISFSNTHAPQPCKSTFPRFPLSERGRSLYIHFDATAVFEKGRLTTGIDHFSLRFRFYFISYVILSKQIFQ